MKKILFILFALLSFTLLSCSEDNPITSEESETTEESSEDSDEESSEESDEESEGEEEEEDSSATAANSLNGKWKYDSSSDTYYVVGIAYCENPADESYEQMGIYVPGAYFKATANSNGTYNCSIDESGSLNGFTASSAPIVIPVNTPGYKAMSPPSGFSSSVSKYTKEGIIYLHAGCRGKDSAAPSAVTDLKAALRYYRYLATAEKSVPGDTDRIFSFGHSGGGAQSAILGASGNSPLYDDYLSGIGAKMDYRDDVAGSMCWCPSPTWIWPTGPMNGIWDRPGPI